MYPRTPSLPLLVVLAVVLMAACTRAAPPRASRRRDVTVTKYSSQPNAGSGQYRYGYELSDGSLRYEEGELKNAGVPGKEALQVRGSFSRPSFDGKGMEQVSYYADEQGFRVAKAPVLGGGASGALIASLVG